MAKINIDAARQRVSARMAVLRKEAKERKRLEVAACNYIEDLEKLNKKHKVKNSIIASEVAGSNVNVLRLDTDKGETTCGAQLWYMIAVLGISKALEKQAGISFRDLNCPVVRGKKT